MLFLNRAVVAISGLANQTPNQNWCRHMIFQNQTSTNTNNLLTN